MGLAIIDQCLEVGFAVAQRMQIIAALKESRFRVDRRDQRIIQHAWFERVSNSETVGTAAHTFIAD